jgi:hypothetical protein
MTSSNVTTTGASSNTAEPYLTPTVNKAAEKRGAEETLLSMPPGSPESSFNSRLNPLGFKLPDPEPGTQPPSVIEYPAGLGGAGSAQLVLLIFDILSLVLRAAKSRELAEVEYELTLKLKQVDEMLKSANLKLAGGLAQGAAMVAAGAIQLTGALAALGRLKSLPANATDADKKLAGSEADLLNQIYVAIGKMVEGLGRMTDSSLDAAANYRDAFRKVLEASESKTAYRRQTESELGSQVRQAVSAAIEWLKQYIANDNSVFMQLHP